MIKFYIRIVTVQVEYEKHLFQTVSAAMRLVVTFQNINCTKDSLTVLTEIFQDDVRLFWQGAGAEAYHDSHNTAMYAEVACYRFQYFRREKSKGENNLLQLQYLIVTQT